MEPGNATCSGKVWENIQPRKESMEYFERLRLGLSGQEWGFFMLNSMTSNTMKCGGVSAVRLDLS